MTDTRDTTGRILRSTRFFARLVSFDLECPHCGTVYIIRQVTGKGRVVRSQQVWDPTTGRFKCTTSGCDRSYVLGLLAWPIAPAPRVASATPEDQVPWPRQLAALRKEGGGWWLPDDARITDARPNETNLTTEEDRPDREDEDEETNE